jgi:hypothetical protein
MINLTIKPHVGISKIELGMNRNIVHDIMGNNFIAMKKGNAECECYYDFCFQIHYDNNIVNFIEIVNNPIFEVVYKGQNIFTTEAEELISFIEQSSKYLNTQEAQLCYAYIFEDIGLSLYRSNVFKEKTMDEAWFQELSQEQKDDESKYLYFESVSIFSKGYYDSIKPFL